MSSISKNSICHFTLLGNIFHFCPELQNFTFHIFACFFKQNTLINVKFAVERPLEYGRFVEQNDFIATFLPLFVIDFVGNAKGQWNIGKCLNMPASVRTAEQMPLWNTVQSSFFNWRHTVSRVNFPCHTIHSQSMSLVNVYSPWSLVNTYMCAWNFPR